MALPRPFRRPPPTAWTVWLLFAAWFCANSPQSVTYEVIVWAQGGQHFSHQADLRTQVARLLGGRPPARAAFRGMPAKPFTPPLPASAIVKKLDLFAALTLAGVLPAATAFRYPAWSGAGPRPARPEPPLPPPRGLAFA